MKKLLVIFLVGMLHLGAWEVKKGTEIQLDLNTNGDLNISKGGLSVKNGISFKGPNPTYDVWIQGGNGYASNPSNTRNLALLGHKTQDKLYLNYNGEYTAGVKIQSKVEIETANLPGALTITGNKDINGANSGGTILIQSRSDNVGVKLRIEANEIQASENGTASWLGINPFGGVLSLGNKGEGAEKQTRILINSTSILFYVNDIKVMTATSSGLTIHKNLTVEGTTTVNGLLYP